MKALSRSKWEKYKKENIKKVLFSKDDIDNLIKKAAVKLPSDKIQLHLYFDDDLYNDDGKKKGGKKKGGWVVVRTSPHDALFYRLNQEAELFLSPTVFGEDKKAPKILEREINKIKNMCDKILEKSKNRHVRFYLMNMAKEYARANGSYEDIWCDSNPNFSGKQALDRTLVTLAFLSCWANMAGAFLNEEKKRNKDKRSPHKGKIKQQQFIESLCCIWRDIFKKKVQTSCHGTESSTPGKADGPLVRFVVEAFNCIGKKISGGAARNAIIAAKKQIDKEKPENVTRNTLHKLNPEKF